MKGAFTVEHSPLQLNSLMTFSQVAAAEISFLEFYFVKCTSRKFLFHMVILFLH